MEYIIFVLMKALYLNFASNITFYKINDLKITVKDTFKIVSASIFVAGIYTMLREYHTLNIIITFAMMVCIKSLPGMWADACGIRSIISGDTIRTRSMVD